MANDDVDFSGDDVFADIQSDPLAEEQAPAEEQLPEGVAEGQLAGDNPTEELAPPPPGEFMEEPEEPEPIEAELPGEAEALAAAAEADPVPPVADPPPEPPPAPADPPPPAEADPPPPAPEPPAEPPADPPPAPADPPPPEPPVEPEPAPPAPEPDPPAEPEAEKPKPKKERKKRAKKAAKTEEAKPRETTRSYTIMYEGADGGFHIVTTVTARNVKRALEDAFPALEEATGQKSFKNVAAVPSNHWNPKPLSGETEQRSVINIG